MNSSGPGVPTQPAARGEKSRALVIVIGLASALVLIAAVVSGLQQASLARRQTTYAHCQAKVNDALINAQNARVVAANQDRDALDRMVSDITRAMSRADTEAALARYQQTRAATDAERKRHPLPAPPSQSC